jgi:hypothetical protein
MSRMNGVLSNSFDASRQATCRRADIGVESTLLDGRRAIIE